MESKDFLQKAAERPAGNEVSTSIRDFLALWGAKRRGFWVVKKINDDLAHYGLTTSPSFESGWIDNRIKIVLKQMQEPAGSSSPAATATPEASQVNWLRVSSLESANRGLVSVSKNDSLRKVQSLMIRHDYSQLPVIEGGRRLEGAVSWESIAKATVHSPEADLKSCISPADIVSVDDDLLSQIPRIIDAGYLFVRDTENLPCGIVTTADLSQAFQVLAGPFLLAGEAERHLRQIVNRNFTTNDIREAKNPNDPTRQAASAEDLTIGEIQRLLERPSNWERIEWYVDRGVFLDGLQGLRELRNEIMHFSPDPPEADALVQARNFLKWLELLNR